MNATPRLLFATLALGLATGLQAETNVPAIVYCKTRIMPSGLLGDAVLSMTLPPTPGYTDQNGNPVTVWNPGNVTAGGVADSWHSGGPGYFTVRNTGNVEAYVYVVALSRGEIESYDHDIYGRYGNIEAFLPRQSETLRYVWGEAAALNPLGPRPTPRADELVNYWNETYHLALTTDMTAVAPTWRSLDHALTVSYGAYQPWQSQHGYFDCQCSAFLASVAVGDYQPFDLKFWAPPEEFLPRSEGQPMSFVFTVEASSFPRWEHDR